MKSNAKQRLHKGSIIAVSREKESGVSLLAIEDDLRGKVLIPCEGTPTARAFDTSIGGVIIGGRFNNDGIVGVRIAYRVDVPGVLSEFTPIEDADVEVSQ